MIDGHEVVSASSERVATSESLNTLPSNPDDGAKRLLRGIASFEAVKGVLGYVVMRFTEAYGLWHARPWGEKLGALSGALYVPFERQHLIHRPSALTLAVLTTNVAVVGFLVWRLRRRTSAPPPVASAGP